MLRRAARPSRGGCGGFSSEAGGRWAQNRAEREPRGMLAGVAAGGDSLEHVSDPVGKACAISSVSSLCVLFPPVLSPLLISLALPAVVFGEQFGALCPAPSELLGRILGLPGTPIVQAHPEGRAVLSCPGGRKEHWRKGLAPCHTLGKFLRLEEDFHSSFCPLVQAAPPPLPSVCPGGDGPRPSGVFLVPLVRFCHFSAFLPILLFSPEASAGAGPSQGSPR